MKNTFSILILAVAFSLSVPVAEIFAQPADSFYTLQGRVTGEDSREPLANASISLQNSNISSVVNQDGYFTLRVPVSARDSKLLIRHLGYENKIVSVAEMLGDGNNEFVLKQSSIRLSEVEVISGDGSGLVRDALRRIPENYPDIPNMMVAFYRESIKKSTSYISLVETVLDIYKFPYKSYEDDQAKIYIGRKATDISPRDTVIVKFQGGISGALMLDVAKNPGVVFGETGIDYLFHIEGTTSINDKPHYIISFTPRETTEILFRGTIYLDARSLAFARMDFNMNVEGRKDAANVFVRRKPAKMRAKVNSAHYVVDFMEKDGKWYFNYSKTDVAFSVRWTNRFFGLFATNYTIGSEIAITDRYQDNISKFPRKDRIRSTDVIAEKVESFQDPDFWGEYNIIEPDKEITNAIKKLSGKLLRRN